MNDAVCIIKVGCATYGVVAPELDDAGRRSAFGARMGKCCRVHQPYRMVALLLDAGMYGCRPF